MIKIMTTEEILKECMADRYIISDNCEWIMKEYIISLIEEYMYDGQSQECIDLCFALLKGINGYYGSKPQNIRKNMLKYGVLNKFKKR